MSDFEWVDKCETPDIGEDGLELLTIMDEFDQFPNNTYYAQDKRLETLKGYMDRILDIDMVNPTVAHVASQWLARLEGLIWITERFGRDKWYQKNIRKRIKSMRTYKDEAVSQVHDSDQYWYSMTAKEMMEEWYED